MAGLVPAIHVFLHFRGKTWMPGTKAGHDERENYLVIISMPNLLKI